MKIRDGRSIGLAILVLLALVVGLRVLALAITSPIIFVGLALAVAGGAVWSRYQAQTQLRANSASASSELARMRAEVDRLNAELSDARESAELAWDAAADRPPLAPRGSTASRERLIATPMSGVRPLYPTDDGTEQA